MNSPYHPIDYATTLFEYPVLKKIHGMSTFTALTENAKHVSSRLGGGANGHLGLVLTPEEYQTASNTPYAIPPFPGELTLLNGVDPAEAVKKKGRTFGTRQTILAGT